MFRNGALGPGPIKRIYLGPNALRWLHPSYRPGIRDHIGPAPNALRWLHPLRRSQRTALGHGPIKRIYLGPNAVRWLHPSYRPGIRDHIGPHPTHCAGYIKRTVANASRWATAR
ncbi:hypothetical protein [Aliidiomarina sanyensis]|uniref:hypothetical protein n=1 Tax=Aliidiomarina sanyensis TaxID=1249555 RepID=UPI0013007514|nr:hypothetical protein [Aliidiomarina sanyensis]